MPGLFDNTAVLKEMAANNSAPTVQLSDNTATPVIRMQRISTAPTADTANTKYIRSHVTAPISNNGGLNDVALYQSPQNNQQYYLPRYSVAEEKVNNDLRFRVAINQQMLEVFLQTAPAPDIAQQVQSAQAQILPHELDVELHFSEAGTMVIKSFQEVTFLENGRFVRAVLRLQNLEAVDQIYKALTDVSYNTSLSVRRKFKAATAQTISRNVASVQGGYFQATSAQTHLLNLSNAGTISAWVHTASPHTNMKILGRLHINPWRGWVMGLYQNKPYCELLDSNGSNTSSLNFANQLVQANQWTHMAMSWRVGGQYTIYVNGVSAGAAALNTPVGQSNNPFYIGISPWDPRFFHYRGLVRNVAIWNSERSHAQIKNDMNYVADEADLVAHWKLETAHEEKGHFPLQQVGAASFTAVNLTYYTEREEALPLTVDSTFTFSPQLYGYIFSGVGVDSKNQANGLIRHTIQDGNQWFVYYQDSSQRNRFYYLPDSFKLGIHQGKPLLALRFESKAGYTIDELTNELDFIALPYVNETRLRNHAEQLRQFAPGMNQIVLPPLFDNDKTSYQLNIGKSSTHKPKSVSLQRGIFDTVTMNGRYFDTVWGAIFSKNPIQTILTGTVTVEIQKGIKETIPVSIRLDASLNTQQTLDAIFQTEKVTTYEKTVKVETFDDFTTIKMFIVDFGEQSVRLQENQASGSVRVMLPLRDVILRTEDAGFYTYGLNVVTAQNQQNFPSQRSDAEDLIIFNPS